MKTIKYSSAPVPVRRDIEDAHNLIWRKLAEPGTWWTGAQRVAIAAEARNARDCALCQRRKSALSTRNEPGRHNSKAKLTDPVVELVHRVTTDPARLSQAWYRDLVDAGLTDAEYVETLGVVVRTVSIDSFCRGIGIDDHPLPVPVSGLPSRQRPASATMESFWVPSIPNAASVGNETDLYGGVRAANVVRALSLVPDEVRQSIHTLLPAQYVPLADVLHPERDPGRAISRTQIELVAARVSALNQCFY